ncbi:MAG TPA: hypothetical protein VGK71_10205 [Nitrospirota bacterium]
MGKGEKKKKPRVKKIVMSWTDKVALKATLKALKAEKDAAVAEHDPKKIKAVRFKMKTVNNKLKKVKAEVPVLVKKEKPAAEAPAAE